jgi:hypothetical protein
MMRGDPWKEEERRIESLYLQTALHSVWWWALPAPLSTEFPTTPPAAQQEVVVELGGPRSITAHDTLMEMEGVSTQQQQHQPPKAAAECNYFLSFLFIFSFLLSGVRFLPRPINKICL